MKNLKNKTIQFRVTQHEFETLKEIAWKKRSTVSEIFQKMAKKVISNHNEK
ncbi:hypothetical protein [Flammeovirga aprica]|uniref:CopG family transcriptional regulator n=1 Tax=Flammeovirga aprica JL-4 TaxID=694437 RepID=A0A7X9XD57_9BACT|nr:hypothetical protein [Flammeovirga aprica]NME72299.1 hypothetical protein [Flammeovirga aprica JL-4]